MKNYNAECLIARYQERPISIGKIANYKNEIQAPRKIVTDKRDNSRVITIINDYQYFKICKKNLFRITLEVYLTATLSAFDIQAVKILFL